MNKRILMSLLVVSAGLARADAPALVNADGSELSAICIAAVTSREAMYDKAAELGVRHFDDSELRCNGKTLARFVSNYRALAASRPVGYVFRKTDDTPVTELCLAAVRSEQEYQNVKERHFSSEENIEAEVECNGMPLLTFARRYRVTPPAISLR